MSSFNKHLLQSMCLTLYKLAQVPQVRQFQWAAILLITIGETSVVSCNHRQPKLRLRAAHRLFFPRYA